MKMMPEIENGENAKKGVDMRVSIQPKVMGLPPAHLVNWGCTMQEREQRGLTEYDMMKVQGMIAAGAKPEDVSKTIEDLALRNEIARVKVDWQKNEEFKNDLYKQGNYQGVLYGTELKGDETARAAANTLSRELNPSQGCLLAIIAPLTSLYELLR